MAAQRNRINRPESSSCLKVTTTSRPPGTFRLRRRGVASVLAMMFLVLFGSLAAAMAVVAQGNLRTADSSLKVSRAMSAAETGLVFASRRLASETRRFVVEKGVIDSDYAEDLWLGTYNEATDGAVVVLPAEGYDPGALPAGIVYGVRDAHLADAHTITPEPGDGSLPTVDPTFGTLRARPIALTVDEQGAPNPDGPYFRLRYELVAGEPLIRVTSEGVDRDVRRVLQLDFRLEKKIEFAVLSPNRIMIGKNVMIEGPLGSLFGKANPADLESENGDPLILRSDFYHLDDALDDLLDIFFAEVVEHDVDGDGRLRPNHPLENQGLANPSLVDYNNDEYVDDFDLFLAHFDTNSDRRLAYRDPNEDGLAVEFDVDYQLGRLMDRALADRDLDGQITASDTALGYDDGIIDSNDFYAKINGRLAFGVARETWEAAHGDSYQTVVRGPIDPEGEDPPVTFEADENELREITTDMFNDSQSWFEAQVPVGGTDFDDQVASNPGVPGQPAPQYVAPDDTTWEDVPFGSTAAGGGAYDWYQRPIYRNMIFNNVRIPMGTNALFENCLFVGVTYIEAEECCVHENWNYAGSRERLGVPGSYTYPLKFPDLNAQIDCAGEGTVVVDTRPFSNNIRFDECTFLGSVAGDRLGEYTHWRNKIQFTGTTRFYLDSEDDELANQADAGTLIPILESMEDDDIEELAKSSILMPGWSLDVGNFTNEQEANPEDTPVVQLRGTIIAGILDVRGTADVFGTLLMTFRPVADSGPLYYGGQPDAFNTTLGYFGPVDGDSEGVNQDDASFTGFGEIRLRYNPNALLPDGIPWPVRMTPEPNSYLEGGQS